MKQQAIAKHSQTMQQMEMLLMQSLATTARVQRVAPACSRTTTTESMYQVLDSPHMILMAIIIRYHFQAIVEIQIMGLKHLTVMAKKEMEFQLNLQPIMEIQT